MDAGVDHAQEHVVAGRGDDRQCAVRRPVVGPPIDQLVLGRERRHVERAGIRVEFRVDVGEEQERLLVVGGGRRAVGLARLRGGADDEGAVEPLPDLLGDVLVEGRDADCGAGLVDRRAESCDEGVRRLPARCDLRRRRSHRLLRHRERDRLAEIVVKGHADGVTRERVERGTADLRDRGRAAVVCERLDRQVGCAGEVDRPGACPDVARHCVGCSARAGRRAVGVGHRRRVAGVVDRGHREGVGAGGRIERLAVRHRSRARREARAAEVGATVDGVDGLVLREDGALCGRRQRDRRCGSVDGVGVDGGVRVAVGVGGIDRERLRAGGRRVDRGSVCDVAGAGGDRSERARVGSCRRSRRGRSRRSRRRRRRPEP